MKTGSKMKLVTDSLSSYLSHSPERTAAAFTVLGNAFLQAAAILQGKPVKGSMLATSPEFLSGSSMLTVNELVNEFLLAKARAGRSDRYLRTLRVSLKSFCSGRARTPIERVQAVDLEKWISASEWSARTCRGYVSDVRTMFNYAVRRGYVDRNPGQGVELPIEDGHGKIAIHDPAQVKKVLETARSANIDVCRRLAIRYFAGVHSAEANRLT